MIFATLRHMLFKQSINLKFFILSVIWASMIYYLSSIPDLKSDFNSLIDFILRKGAHIFVYMILSYLLAKIFDQKSWRYLSGVVLVSLLYAISDEWHQSLVIDRSGNARDVLIDLVGIFLGIMAYRWFKKR